MTLLTTSTSVGDVLESYAYTLGPAGNRTRIDEQDGTSRLYTYDALYRLTQDRVTDGTAAQVYQRDFTYDAVGNRLGQTVDEGSGPVAEASTYDTRDRLLTASGTSYAWDDNGNLTSQDEASYGWDFENRLTSITTADGTVVHHTYDVDGNRVRTSVTPPGEPTTVIDYLVDTTGPLSHVVAEVLSGSVQTLYTRADDQLIGLFRPSTGTTRYYHADGLGSVRALSDETGDLTDRYSYTAFGELLEHAGSDPNPYRFAGETIELSSGFYYNRARWLDVAAGGNTQGGSGFKRGDARIEDGNAKEGWQHIRDRHILGTDLRRGPGDLFPPGTTRPQVQNLATWLVRKGVRTSNPLKDVQVFERRTTFNGLHVNHRVVVVSADGNRVITIFPDCLAARGDEMLNVEFVVTPSDDPCGFDNGDVILKGEHDMIELNSMVIIAADHLMEEMKQWYENDVPLLEYNAVDSREYVKFVRNSEEVTLFARGRTIGTENVRTLLVALLRAASELYASFVSKFDDEDPVKGDFEMSINGFREFMASLELEIRKSVSSPESAG